MENEGEGQARGGERAAIQAGEVLARRYQVTRHLGEGGMGAVFEVFDRELDEPVALKLLHAELSVDPDYRQRLRQEVRLARRVSHPNVCRVHDLGQHGKQLFVTMELLRGPTLRDILRSIDNGDREPLTLGRKIDLVVQLCAALAAAHRVGIVHRDVKPDNVIVEEDRSVLTDFGVASQVEITGRGVVVGTPHYMAPEILLGEAATPPSDVYACALVAYELLAGRPPYRTGGLRDAMERSRTPPPMPPLPEDIAPPAARAALEQVLARALDVDPAGRPKSVARLAEQVAMAARGTLPDDLAGVGVPVAADSPSGRARRSSTEAPPITDAEKTAVVELRERALARVATALFVSFRSQIADLIARASPEETTLDTRPVVAVTEGGELEGYERIITQLGGTVVESRPGEILALFGVPRALGDEATRAARAGHALVTRCSSARVGLHTGRVNLGAHPTEPRAAGEAVARARDLVRFADEGHVLASEVTTRHLIGRYPLFKVPTSGGAHLVQPGELSAEECYELVPLCGRAGEIHRLERFVREVCQERRPRAALVVGSAGSGKSRLLREVERRISERREIEWLVARASPLGESVPLGLLRRAAPDWFAAAEKAAAGGRSASFAAARQWLEMRAAVRPVVVAFDDVHWADPASLEFLAELRQTLESLPIAIMLFASADSDTPPVPFDVDLRLSLRPLTEDASRAIVRHLAPNAADDVVDELAARAGGNPFFIEEMARELAESHQRAGDLPPTVELVIQARIDRLPRPARRLVHAASVVGREFDRGAVQSALAVVGPVDRDVLDRAFAELEKRQIIAILLPPAASSTTPPPGSDERYIFHNLLMRDVAYAQLDADTRRRAHGAVAAYLEHAGAASREPHAMSALASHRDLAGDRRAARDAYRAAGEMALELAAHREARDAFERAERLSEGPDAGLFELLGDALIHLDSTQASDRYVAALDVASDRLMQARLCHKLGSAASGRSDNQVAITWFERGLGLLGTEDELDTRDPRVRTLAARLYGSLGWVVGYEIGDHERGLPYCERAVGLLDGQGDLAELGHALSRLAANYMRAGRWRDRLRCNQRNLVIARALGDLERELTAHINLGVNYHVTGDLDTAVSHTREALSLGHRTGRAASRALAHNNLGLILVDTGAAVAAKVEVDQAIELANRVGYTRFLPEAYTTLARLALQIGNLEQAERHARHALSLAVQARSTAQLGETARILAGVLSRRGDRDAEAEDLVIQAENALARDQFELARTWAVAAKHEAVRGRREAAAAHHASAAAVFDSLGAALDLAKLDDPADLR